MGPLVPGLINGELNLVVALLVGLGFGFVLEQAGFSSSRKLAGLFFGYDFVVLRVFFTAGITAMIGVVVLSHFGWLDITRIYINPTFLYPAIVGGLIMGAGFITGGFCPGTSVCAAATGKIDAMAFIFGTFIGVFGFAEFYPLFREFFVSSNFGAPLLSDVLGVSRGVFAFLMTAMALVAFVATNIIEKRVNGVKTTPISLGTTRSVIIVGAVAIIGFVMIFMPDIKTASFAKASKLSSDVVLKQAEAIDPDDLVVKLLNRDRLIQVIDVRTADEFKASHIPSARNIPYDELANPEWRTVLQKADVLNVFYGTDEVQAGRASLMSKYLDDNSVNKILPEGFAQFKSQYIDFDATSTKDESILRFRTKAKTELQVLLEDETKAPPPPPKAPKIVGGC